MSHCTLNIKAATGTSITVRRVERVAALVHSGHSLWPLPSGLLLWVQCSGWQSAISCHLLPIKTCILNTPSNNRVWIRKGHKGIIKFRDYFASRVPVTMTPQPAPHLTLPVVLVQTEPLPCSRCLQKTWPLVWVSLHSPHREGLWNGGPAHHPGTHPRQEPHHQPGLSSPGLTPQTDSGVFASLTLHHSQDRPPCTQAIGHFHLPTDFKQFWQISKLFCPPPPPKKTTKKQR